VFKIYPHNIKELYYSDLDCNNKGLINSNEIIAIISELTSTDYNKNLPRPERGGDCSYIDFKIIFKDNKTLCLFCCLDKKQNLIYLSRNYRKHTYDATYKDAKNYIAFIEKIKK